MTHDVERLSGSPAEPVEAFIALSIVFVAVEVVRAQRGETSLASRKPWLIAFTFGLLHGLGFASALAEIGRGWSKTQAPMPFELADSYCHFCHLNLNQNGIVN